MYCVGVTLVGNIAYLELGRKGMKSAQNADSAARILLLASDGKEEELLTLLGGDGEKSWLLEVADAQGYTPLLR